MSLTVNSHSRTEKAPKYLKTKSKAHFILKTHDYGTEDNLGVEWHHFLGEFLKKTNVFIISHSLGKITLLLWLKRMNDDSAEGLR